MNEEQERMLTAWNDPPASQAEEIAEARLWAAEQKPTPGPWRISGESATIVQADNRAIGSESGLLIASANGYPDSGYFPSEHQAMANARLIAAAPELLEALRLFITLYGTDDVTAWQYIRDKAVSAIAKAEGREP